MPLETEDFLAFSALSAFEQSKTEYAGLFAKVLYSEEETGSIIFGITKPRFAASLKILIAKSNHDNASSPQ